MAEASPGPEVWYSPGSWIAVTGVGRWLLADIGPDHPVALRCWELIVGGADIERVLGAIADEGLRAVASFAAVQHQRGRTRVIVRGAAWVELVATAGESAVVRAEADATWLDRTVTTPQAALRLGGPSGAPLGLFMPLLGGMALASGVVVTLTGGEPITGGATGLSDAELVAEPLDAELLIEPMDDEDADAEPVDGSWRADVMDADPRAADSLGVRRRDEPRDSEPRDDERPESGASADELEERLDRLFVSSRLWGVPPHVPQPRPASGASGGSTGTPPVQAGAHTLLPEPETEPKPDPEPDPEPIPRAPAAEPPSGPRHDGSVTPWQVDDSGIIQAITFSGQEPPRPTPPQRTPTHAQPTPVDELEDAMATRMRGGGDRTVPATRCPAGHLNPPDAGACRACGAPVPPQEPERIPKPVLGVLRPTAGGDAIALDRAVIMGRAPDPAAGHGPGRANAIRVESPGMDVSRNHVEFRPDGWQLLVTDLGSANGTTITLPGSQPGQRPVPLRPHTPVVVPPGAVVTLADEVSLRYEVDR